jgi:hypothetical protein
MDPTGESPPSAARVIDRIGLLAAAPGFSTFVFK